MAPSGNGVPSAARRMENKVVLITGAAGEIGVATARLLAQQGAKLLLTDINDDRGLALTAELGSDVARYVHCDVTDESQVSAAVNETLSSYGRLDAVFANAGTLSFPYTPLQDADLESYERVMAVNVKGVLLTLKHAARVMVPERRGSIVVTGSAAAVVGGIWTHAYVCSKHAALGLARNAAAELGKVGVRVNCVSPYALVSTLACKALGMEWEEFEAHMERKAALKGLRIRAEDVAEAVLFLASDESRYVNGHNLVVDGGFTATNSTLIPAQCFTNGSIGPV